MNKTNLIVTLLAGLLFTNISLAQRGYAEGYVVTYENDTLFGKIKHMSGDELKERIIFKKSPEEREYYDAEEIKFFKVGLFRAVSMQLEGEDEPVFLKILAKGQLTVYEHQYEKIQNGYEVMAYDVYVSKAEKPGLIEIRPGNFRKTMEELISDVPKLAKAVNDKVYRMEDIGVLAKEYNRIKASK